MLQVIKEKIFEEIPVAEIGLHQYSITRNNYAAWHKIMTDSTYSDPTSIESMCSNGCVKWKEITRVKIHGTLLERR